MLALEVEGRVLEVMLVLLDGSVDLLFGKNKLRIIGIVFNLIQKYPDI